MIDERRHSILWDVLSFVLHVALLALLVFCTPVRELVLPNRADSPPSVAEATPEEIGRLDEKLSEVRLRELSQDVETLQTVLNDMDVIRDQLRDDFDEIARDFAGSAKDELRRAVGEAKRLQGEIVSKQEKAGERLDDLARAEKRDLADSHDEIKEIAHDLYWEKFMEVSAAQAESQNALDKIRNAAAFAGLMEVAKAASELREAQIAAARGQSAEMADILATTGKLAEFDRHGRTKADNDRRAAEARRDEAENRADQAKAEADAKAAAGRQDRNAARSAENKAKNFKHRAENAARRADEFERRSKEAAAKMDELSRFARKIDTESQKRRHEDAKSLQKGVLEAMAELDAAIERDVANPVSHASDETPGGELAKMETARLTVSEAYGLARSLEEAVTESYREVVAAQTAISQRLPLEEAERLTDVAMPVREDIDASILDGRASSSERFAAQKEARYNAVREAGNMVDSSMAMLDEAFRLAGFDAPSTFRDGKGRRARGLRKLRKGELAGLSDATRKEKFHELSGLSMQIESSAAEDSGNRAKDMRGVTLGGTPASGFSVSDIERRYQRVKGAAGAYVGQPTSLENAGTGPDLLPGNVLSVNEASPGSAGGWMYLESWWVIGPFPNPDRVNITRKFPPESIIDLDAAYEGSGGQVRWQFTQARSPFPSGRPNRHRSEVIPPDRREFAIWYGWTLLTVDEPCDVWLAAGSDDRSDVWVNGVKVWASGNNRKVWTIDEGFRLIHLEKGANSVLVRLENGPGPTSFSVCVSPHSTPPPL